MTAPNAADEVRQRLSLVTDPELDETVTELGFIQDIDVDPDNHVRVTLRLPTYWCAANFAFMMAQDIRDEIEKIPWVRGVSVELLDHFSAGEINRGTAARASFSATFEGEADGDLTDLRELFRTKAFLRRQERLFRYLLAKAHAADELIRLDISQLAGMAIPDQEGAQIRERYLAARNRLADPSPSSPAFVTPNGRPLAQETLPDHLKQLRGIATNMEFNAIMCGCLLEARNRGKGSTGGD